MPSLLPNGLDTLRFFTGEGTEIQMRRQYSLEWELLPADAISNAFYKNPSGHIEAGRPFSLASYFQEIMPGVFETILIEPQTSSVYTFTVSGKNSEKILSLYDILDENREIVRIIADYNADKAEVCLYTRPDGTVVVKPVSGCTEEVVVEDARGFSFRCCASSQGEYSLIQQSLKAMIVVDEPGIIRPHAVFNRNQADHDYLYDYKKSRSSDGIVTTTLNDAWKEITGDDNTYTLNNIFDIIFFTYKSVKYDDQDDSTYTDYMTNRLQITANDGTDIVTENYDLPDILRGTVETCVMEHLTTGNAFETTDDGFFLETPEELKEHDVSQTTTVYGIKDEVFAQVRMEEYDQWDTDLVISLANLFIRVRKSPSSYTDEKILANVLASFKRYDFKTEYWNSAEVVSIVRTGSVESAIEDARHLLVFLVYAGEPDEIISQETVMRYVLEYNIPASQYPFVRYAGIVNQDKISADFVMPQTIVVVNENEDGKYVYPSITDGEDEYRLFFRFSDDSEMFFLTMEDNMEMGTLQNLFALLPSEINTLGNPRETNALHFTIGFKASREGCYRNSMGIFMRNLNTDEDFFLGVVEFRSTVVGEDERYRTLLENFGIPDPKIYPNIFREQDPDEQGVDWRLVNKKSKELMLSYDSIFPYSGTYRALFRAVKFLGYTDVVFKEWYKLTDQNDDTRYVAVQNFDVSTGETLRNVLRSYGIEYGQYQRYSKLNRLSMVYHLQEITDYTEKQLPLYGYVFSVQGQKVCIPSTDTLVEVKAFAENPDAFSERWDGVKCYVRENKGKFYIQYPTRTGEKAKYLSKHSTLSAPDQTISIGSAMQCEFGEYAPRFVHGVDSDGQQITWEDLTEDILAVRNIYEFRNDELLAKLYQVKQWLERYVTGVGCYISDVNGEAIVLERIKNVAYVTSGQEKDLTSVGKFTPHAAIKTHDETAIDGSVYKVDDKFRDSSICITCGLNEFRSLSFEDYADFPIERFIKWEYDADGNEKPMEVSANIKHHEVNMPVYVSAPLNALTVADEFKYGLEMDYPDSGSLYEFADASCLDNPIIVANGEITLFDPSKKTSSVTNAIGDENASCECPVIEITKGNIREVYGDWEPDSEDSNIAWSIVSAYAEDGNYYVTLSSQSPDYLYETEDKEMLKKYRKYDDTHVYPDFRFKGSMLLTPESDNARFEYTSVNKWEVPMIIISGYYPSNQMNIEWQMRPDFRAANEHFFPREHKFILEIFQGTLKFRNHKVKGQEKFCNSAEVIFGDATVEEGEQPVFIKYKWASDRLPVYDFDRETFKEHLSQGVLADMQAFYDKMGENVTVNSEVDIPVNRLGEYRVSVQAYDAYNNIYANSGDDSVVVTAGEPDIEILVNQEESGNSPEFYSRNFVYGTDSEVSLLDETETRDVSSMIGKVPEFPIEYRIYSAEHDASTKQIVYDNISYALDTPKEGDRLILTNMTESAYSVNVSGKRAVVDMKSGNPGKQQIYNLGGTVTLSVWDENLKDTVCEITGCDVIACRKPSKKRKEVYYADGQLTVTSDDMSELNVWIGKINDRDSGIELYVIDTTSVDITGYAEHIINSSEYSEDVSAWINTAFIPVDEDDIDNFADDTMIKLRVEYTDVLEIQHPMIVNESAYRVIRHEERYVEGLDASVDGYVLEGHVDTGYFDGLRNRDIFDESLAGDESSNRVAYEVPTWRFTMKPLHDSAVEYSLDVTKDADETLYVYNDYKFYGQKTVVDYDDGKLMLGAYLDDQYAARVMRYDPQDLMNIWSDEMIDGSVYCYRNAPVTVQPGRKVIVRGLKNIESLEDGWKSRWKWRNYVIEDMTNLRDRKPQDMTKILLFETDSSVLSVKPELLGSQFVELFVRDKYGNVISNTGGGNIMVQEEDDSENVVTLL